MATDNKVLQNFTVVHRLCFSARSLPLETPHYWEIVRDFSLKGRENAVLSTEECRVFAQNMLTLHKKAFDSDIKLTREVVKVNKTDPKRPQKIGFVLISPNSWCILCKKKLM